MNLSQSALSLSFRSASLFVIPQRSGGICFLFLPYPFVVIPQRRNLLLYLNLSKTQ
jgi:hypothetical protein